MHIEDEIKLTLGEEVTSAGVAAAAAEVQAAIEARDKEEAPDTTELSVPVQKPIETIADYKLSPKEQEMVDDFAKQIDISDSKIAMTYGSAAQKNISMFSENTLNSVRSKDLGEVGTDLASLVGALKGFDAPDQKGFMGFFRRRKQDFENLKANYDSVSQNIDKITERLESHQIGLMKDIALLDKLYELNEKYQRELTMYILAGKQALEAARAGELVELQKKAAETGLPEDAQAYNDFANICTRFEKRLHDLELTRTVSIQMGPQTRMIQNNDVMVLEKIQSSISNTIPLWKSQIVLALGIENSRQATSAVGAVTDMTNELLRKNADTLKMGTVEVARESERSIVSIDSLKHANEQLISSIDEVMKIQADGAQKRREAEVELAKIEDDLKRKLLELKAD